MRIVIISSLYGTAGGGSGVMAQHLAHGLVVAGHAVTVITMGQHREYEVDVDHGIRIYRFRPVSLYPLQVKDKHPAWQKMIWQMIDIYNPHAVHVLRKVLKKESPDVIHINKMRGFSGAVWSVATDLFPGRVIQTCHDYESMSPDGLLRGSIGNMALNNKWPVRGYQLIRARLSSSISIVTAPSKFTLSRIAKSGLFPNAETVVIPNTHGWDDEQLRTIQAEHNSSPAQGICFLFIGRLESEKGVLELCEAFSSLYTRHPSLRLDIAGSGTLEPYLREKYSSHSGIRFLGMVDGKPKEDALQRATVVVVPSNVEEVFGLANIEAFAFGKPVVASNIGGIPELVHTGETGWLFEPGKVDSLKEVLEGVISIDPRLLLTMGQNCLTFSRRFSKDRVVREYEEVYARLVK
jgi:glycosyltransferase involved in cell wall biosynthesis